MEKVISKELAPKIFAMMLEGLSRTEIAEALNLNFSQYSSVCQSTFFMKLLKSSDRNVKEEQLSELERRLWLLIDNYNDGTIKLPEDRAHLNSKIDKLGTAYSIFVLYQ